MLAPDTLLQNRYLIIRLIAEGGMGAVYLAKDQRLGNTVALKQTFFTDERLSKAFEREARLLASLRHASLPKVSDHFTEGGGQFLVMEFIPGNDLAELLQRRGGPFPPDEVLRWGDHLLGALIYLHKQHPPIIHRDIKPQNLKLTDESEIVLLDFGLAKGAPLQMSRVTSSGSILGYTPSYAPLEQIQGSGTDPRSDLYSLAATLYHLMTGKVPVDALSRATAVLNGEADPLVPISEFNPQVSEGVARILMQSMSLKRDLRPISAAEMRKALREAGQLSGGLPRPAGESVINTSSRSADKLAARYEIIKPINRGDANPAYQARDKKTGEMVRLIPLSQGSDDRFFAQVCGALARLKHKNIIGIVDFDLKPPSPYLATEYIRGPALSDYLQAHQPLALPVAAVISRQLFNAAAYAHEQSVIHSNLNPTNIFLELTSNGLAPKIFDFGSAILDKLTGNDDNTRSSTQAGRIQYRAPEQIDGITPDESCDVYSLGQMLWEMIVGRPAFQGDVMTVIREKMRLTEGLDISREVQDAPGSLAELITRCTRRDPEKRPKAREVADLLNKIVPEITPPAVLAPFNMGFDTPDPNGKPPGWFNSFGYVDNVSTHYEFELAVRENAWTGSCVQMWSARAGADDFGSLMQRCPGWHLSGRRVRFEGEMRTDQVSQWAGLWLRADSGGRTLFFYNMHDRPVVGSTPWSRYSIEANIPPGADWINYGILLVGAGQVWADNLQLLVEDRNGSWHSLNLWDEAKYASL